MCNLLDCMSILKVFGIGMFRLYLSIILSLILCLRGSSLLSTSACAPKKILKKNKDKLYRRE